MASICKKCGGSLTIKEVIMNSHMCSNGAKVLSLRPVGLSNTAGNYKNYIKLNFDAIVAAELKKGSVAVPMNRSYLRVMSVFLWPQAIPLAEFQ
jgi:hypothetical protein